MKKIKIITIVGARPQFIKAATVSREFLKHNSVEEIIVHTGQHYDFNMSDSFYHDLEIPSPKYKMSLERRGHSGMTGEILIKLESILDAEKPDFTLIYGDTNSTLAGALASVKVNIPVAHVESGLRSFNNKMPEEINRIVADRISSILFCPTEAAVTNLANEGITKNVFNTGDVMYDSVLYFKKNGIKKTAELGTLELNNNFVFATVHRQENVDKENKLREVIECLKNIAQHFQVVLPLHPRTKKMIETFNIDISGITIIEPVGYFSILYLLSKCKMVFTDSGGLQKEAYFFGKTVGILRDETEWVELVENKVAYLIGSNKELALKSLKESDTQKALSTNFYGDGTAAQKIVDIICNY